MLIADLHIHSAYSRATSRACDAPNLDLWARRKGIGLVGTGDFTHPAWRQALREALEPAGDGLYALRRELRLPDGTAGPDGADAPVRFVVTGEISSIYKRDGRTRKVHNLILLPGLDEADALAARLERIGNIRSDGRPILGLDSRDLLEITLDTCPAAVFIPAHIWTPHFSLFGAFSGFDTIEACFGDLAGEIHALETGLSSDPPMNWRVSALDRFTLVSNSDAHSPARLGREANLLDVPPAYPALRAALETGDGFAGTIEFFPEEGKYHLDGHRACGVRLTPAETERLGGRCPVCGGRVTVGVEHRVEALADRPAGARPGRAKPFERLVPLPEVIAASIGASVTARGVQQRYERLLGTLGNEFYILREAAVEDIARAAGPCVAEGVRRLREGRVERLAGYDGEYGVIRLFDEAERAALSGQAALFAMPAARPARGPERPLKAGAEAAAEPRSPAAAQLPAFVPDEAQLRAVRAEEPAVAVLAGPGAGKTGTLVARIAYLVETRGVDPGHITAVTFTNLAAAELRERLRARLGAAAERITVGTFHAVCLELLDRRPLLAAEEAAALMAGAAREAGLLFDARRTAEAVSRVRCGGVAATPDEAALAAAYTAALAACGARDLDGLLLDALALPGAPPARFAHLLVDEFQDVNEVQRRLVRKWSAGGESLFVIGDPDQSIYGFRGASARCFAELAEAVPLTTLPLGRSYRATPEILSAALAVIAHNPGGVRRLEAARQSGAPVRLVRMDGPLGEGVWIAKEIARLAGGVDMNSAASTAARPFSDMAVLCRTRRQLARIEECLRHDGIPCVVSGRDDALCDEAVQRSLALFRWLLSPDAPGTLAACLTQTYGVSPPASEALCQCVTARIAAGVAPADALIDAACPPAFAADAALLGPLVAREPPRHLLERYAAVPGRVAAAHRDAFDRLTGMAAYHARMADFLRMLALGEEADLRRASGRAYASGAVRLMTLHGSKGLEFPVVFLAGLQQEQMPLTRDGVCADWEEERRLLYVGMTRAVDELILCAPEPPSPFLAELPPSVACERAHVRLADSRQLRLF